jgi:hypothetical protein
MIAVTSALAIRLAFQRLRNSVVTPNAASPSGPGLDGVHPPVEPAPDSVFAAIFSPLE